MKFSKSDKSIIFALIFSILALIAYKILYQSNNFLFCLAFLCERLYGIGAKDEFNKNLDNLSLNEDNKNALKLILILILIIIFMFIYILLTAPKILIVVVLGEILDVIIEKGIKLIVK